MRPIGPVGSLAGTKEPLHPISLLYIFLSLSFHAAGAVLGKTAALRMGNPTLSAFLGSPWYLGGVACLALQAFFWQLVLREVRLFIACLFTSLNAFLVLAISRVVFDERVTSLNVAGAMVIVAGVYLVVREDLS